MLSGKPRVLLLRSGREVAHLSLFNPCTCYTIKQVWYFRDSQEHKFTRKMNFLDLLRSFDRLNPRPRLLALCKATDPLLQTAF